MGYSIQNANPDEIPIIYANAIRRRIPPTPRTILKSREFTCPPELQSGLNGLETRVKSGVDINQNLSKLLKKEKYHDLLLNDWRVFHFHLGDTFKSDGFVKETGPLLFALVTDSNFYEINVFPHGEWADINIVEIIHRNWPEAIECFKIKGILGISHTSNTADIKKLRKNKIVSLIQMQDGTIYPSIGGGYAIDGTSTEAVIDAIRNKQLVRHLEKWAIDNLVEELEKMGYSEDKPVSIKFEVDEDGMYAACPEYNVRFILSKPGSG